MVVQLEEELLEEVKMEVVAAEGVGVLEMLVEVGVMVMMLEEEVVMEAVVKEAGVELKVGNQRVKVENPWEAKGNHWIVKSPHGVPALGG